MKQISTTLRVIPLISTAASFWLSLQSFSNIMATLPAVFLSAVVGACIYIGMDLATREQGWKKAFGLLPAVVAFVISGIAIHSELHTAFVAKNVAYNESEMEKWEAKETLLIQKYHADATAKEAEKESGHAVIKDSITKIDAESKRIQGKINHLEYERRELAKKYNKGKPSKATKEQLSTLDKKISEKETIIKELMVSRKEYVGSLTTKTESADEYQPQPKTELKSEASPFYLWPLAFIFDLSVWLSIIFAFRYEQLFRKEKEQEADVPVQEQSLFETNVQMFIPEANTNVQTAYVHDDIETQTLEKKSATEITFEQAKMNAEKVLQVIHEATKKPEEKLMDDLKNQNVEINEKDQVVKGQTEKAYKLGRRVVERIFTEAVKKNYLEKRNNKYYYANNVTAIKAARG